MRKQLASILCGLSLIYSASTFSSPLSELIEEVSLPKESANPVARELFLEGIAFYDSSFDPYLVWAAEDTDSTELLRHKAIRLLEEAVERDSTYTIAYFTLGYIYWYYESEYLKAILEFSKVTQLEPKFRDGYIYLGHCLSRIEETAKAIESYRKANVIEESAIAHERMADVYVSLNVLDSAAIHYRRALDLEPGDLWTRLTLGCLEVNMGLYEKASEQFTVIFEDDPKFSSEFYVLVSPGGELHRQATERLEALKGETGNATIWACLGYLYYLVEHYDEAAKDFRAALELEPELSSLYRLLAHSEAKTGNVDAAINAYRKALRDNPEDHFSLSGIGNTFMGTLEPDSAIVYLNRALREHPTDPETYISLGVCYEMKLNKREAINSYREAEKLDPSNKNLTLAIADMYLSIEDYNKAESIYIDFLDRNPNNYTAHLELAQVYVAKGQGLFARIECEEAIQIAPDSSRAYKELGSIYLSQPVPDTTKAKEMFSKCLNLDSLNFQCHWKLGDLYAAQSQYFDALDEFNFLLQRFSDTTLYLDIGWVYNLMGGRNNQEVAASYLETYLDYVSRKEFVETNTRPKFARHLLELIRVSMHSIEYPDRMQQFSNRPGVVGEVAKLLYLELSFSTACSLLAEGLDQENFVDPDVYVAQDKFEKLRKAVKDLNIFNVKLVHAKSKFLEAIDAHINGIELYSDGFYLQQEDSKEYRGEVMKGLAKMRVARECMGEALKMVKDVMARQANVFSILDIKVVSQKIEYYSWQPKE